MIINNLAKALFPLTFICTSGLLYGESLYLKPQGHLYASVDAGVIQANFNSNYWDQTDLIPQNISESILQNGYTGGIALGYSRTFNLNYFLGAELAASFNSNRAAFASGAATAAFSDWIKLKNYVDLTVVPGIITNNSFFPYVKLGLSYASLSDHVTSPVGYNPVVTTYDASKNRFGFVAALGVKYPITPRIVLFTEGNYHDFGTLNWQPFQNFSADYTHSTHICSYGGILGAMYTFDI